MLKKKIIPVFLASVLTVSGTTGFVTEAFSENVYAAEEVHTERLADFADLLDDGQEEELEAKLDQVSEDYGCDVVVVTLILPSNNRPSAGTLSPAWIRIVSPLTISLVRILTSFPSLTALA